MIWIGQLYDLTLFFWPTSKSVTSFAEALEAIILSKCNIDFLFFT